ncbi:nucleolar RNA helicase 2-like isoform X2 [Gigantopelta aegis]|uniref:nucleolar RNA helicase 2-like isoform X2 n=1 Tax=Gigantopelta aegis TaxID=1735272 RepID=UPI001B88DF8E|nr:nucleolar RNA helicase 2-like isoform X2 [Gigantopelta aegis]
MRLSLAESDSTTEAKSATQDNDDALEKEKDAGAFENFDLSKETVKKLKKRSITHLFPIQAKTFNAILEGQDVIARARTGTGKTLSFALPLVEKLNKKLDQKQGRYPKVLVMAPTRELARQVAEDFKSVSKLDVLVIYGGTPYGPQESALLNGVDIVVGTPGRILDHVQKENLVLKKIKHVVLDEVDQMLDMGFADTVQDILRGAYERETTKKRPQTLLFSATVPRWVLDMAKKYMMGDIYRVDLVGEQKNKTSTTVKHLAIKCSYWDRPSMIGDILQVYSGAHGRALVFCQTKKDADELTVSSAIKVESHVLHGDVPQDKREKVLKSFKEGKYKVLITTDVAARGLDIPEVDLVIQCNPPKDTDSYIHRSGRTGRAGRSGVCVCFYKPQEEQSLQYVEHKAGIQFQKIGPPTPEEMVKAAAEDAARSLHNVSPDVLTQFRESAESMITEKGAVDALAAALAVISGNTTIKQRSLLSSREGYAAFVFRTNIELRGNGYVWRALEKQLSPEVKEKVSHMKLLADKMGCCFDIPSDQEQVVETSWTDTKFDSLEKLTELPELAPQANGSSGGQRSYGNGDQRSFGGRGRGRGRGGGGFGGQSRNGGFRNGGSDSQNGFKRKQQGFISNSSGENKRIKFE